MSDRYPGGLITKTPVTPTGPYQDGTAPGIWTLEQQAYWKAQGLWPIAGNTNPGDPYFNYVTMLLTGDGTNGAQNNTFLDSSTNAFSITRNGNTTQGSFSPYGSLWSNYFDGSNSKLTVANNTALNFGTGDFTIEYWFCLPSFSGNSYALLDKFNSGSGWQFYTYSDNKLHFYLNSADLLTTTTSIVAGQWYHVAVTRSGTSAKLFLNGVLEASATNSTDISPTTDFRIGESVGGVGDLVGYVSNARIVKGTAVYTSAFTPSTTPLTAVSGTSLLTCQSNRFIDNSSNAFAITVNGTPSVQRFSPFNPTASYSTATIGGSGYFDGSGDYLTLANNSAFDLGSNNFTVEAWCYPQSTSNGIVITRAANGSTYPTFELTIYSGTWRFYSSSSSSAYNVQLNSNVAPKLNEWQHVAVTRNGSTYTIWINGVSANTATSSASLYANSNTVGIGAYPNAANPFNGYISDLRLVNGTAVYSSTFTPSTAPLTAITNTSLLCNMTNAGIPDSAMMNDLETVGNAQISTTQSKFGGSSMYFDGTGDNLYTANGNVVSFGTGDFTIEAWIYPTAITGYQSVFDSRSGSDGLTFQIKPDATLEFYNGNIGAITSSGTVSANTWTYIALVRTSGTVKIFINGTSSASASGSSALNATFAYIGRTYDGYYFNGYIDDLRITKGYARYTSTFTPPTSAFYTY